MAKKIVITVDGISVTVSGAVLDYMNADKARNRYLARKDGRCAQPDHRQCSGNCFGCPWAQEGQTMLPYETAFRSEDDDPDESAECKALSSAPGTDEMAVDNALKDQMMAEMGKCFGDTGALVFLMMIQGGTVRDIADALHITVWQAHQTVKAIRAYFADHRREWFE